MLPVNCYLEWAQYPLFAYFLLGISKCWKSNCWGDAITAAYVLWFFITWLPVLKMSQWQKRSNKVDTVQSQIFWATSIAFLKFFSPIKFFWTTFVLVNRFFSKFFCTHIPGTGYNMCLFVNWCTWFLVYLWISNFQKFHTLELHYVHMYR